MYTRSMYTGRRRTRAGRRVERANASRAPTPSEARAKEDVGRVATRQDAAEALAAVALGSATSPGGAGGGGGGAY